MASFHKLVTAVEVEDKAVFVVKVVVVVVVVVAAVEEVVEAVVEVVVEAVVEVAVVAAIFVEEDASSISITPECGSKGKRPAAAKRVMPWSQV